MSKGTQGGAGTPHPNGGEIPLPNMTEKMPARHRSTKITHTPLPVPEGDERMPKRHTGQRQTEPRIR